MHRALDALPGGINESSYHSGCESLAAPLRATSKLQIHLRGLQAEAEWTPGRERLFTLNAFQTARSVELLIHSLTQVRGSKTEPNCSSLQFGRKCALNLEFTVKCQTVLKWLILDTVSANCPIILLLSHAGVMMSRMHCRVIFAFPHAFSAPHQFHALVARSRDFSNVFEALHNILTIERRMRSASLGCESFILALDFDDFE